MADRFCSRCGEPVTEGARFCSSCGNALAGGSGPLPPPSPSYPSPPYPSQPSYPPPPGYVAPRPGYNGFAIASMVLGIVWIYWIGSILALIFGYVALSQIRETEQGGRGMAITGITLGWIGIAMLFLVIILALAGAFDE